MVVRILLSEKIEWNFKILNALQRNQDYKIFSM